MKKTSLITLPLLIFISLMTQSCQKQIDYSSSIDSLKQSIANLQHRSDSLAAALAGTNFNLSNLSKKVDSISAQIVIINGQITLLNQQLTAANANISSINAQIIALNQQLANLLAELNALLLQTIPSSLSNGLLAYYSFTGNANDNSGNGNNGIVNGATLTSDRFGNLNNAYRFGTNKNILIPNPSSTLNLTSSFSISTWLTLDSLATIYNSSIIISKHDGDTGTDGWDYGIWNDHSYTSQFLNFWGSGISGYPSTNAIANVNNWYNFITTYDSTSKNISYYISGQLIASKTITLNIIPNTRPITIGYQTSSNGTYYGYFRGSIDDIKIYNRVLTNPEIQYLYFH